MQDLGRLFGNAATVEEGRRLFKDILDDKGDYSWRISTALGLVEGISGRRELQASNPGLLYSLLGENPSKSDQEALEKFMREVASRAMDEDGPNRSRVVATSLLGFHEFEKTGKVLEALLDARHPPEVQLGAVDALSQLGDSRGGAILTAKKTWSGYTPRVKSATIAALASKSSFINELFSAIEAGVIAPAEISSTYRQRLMDDKNPEISQQAGEIFKELEGGGRMQVYQEYREVLDLPSEPTLGKIVFQNNCSACHTYAGEGGEVGPDLSGVNNQPADALLLHTLVPNYEVLPAYQAISVETKDGKSVYGWLLSESDHSLTLRTAFGTEEPILRSNIISIHNSGLSLMPDGLEQTMSRKDLAHLIAYLKSGG
jgi:putative heme-binding domain-containing protein